MIFGKNSKIFVLFLFAFILILPFILSSLSSVSYKKIENHKLRALVLKDQKSKKIATHIDMPKNVKALYMTSFVASEKKMRERIHQTLNETELNSLVIDVKDYTGKISFDVLDEDLKKVGGVDVRVSDLRDFLEDLHKDNIYTIARIAVFQDPFYVKYKPESAVKDLSGNVWKDRKGISWVDPNDREYWDYIVKIGKASYEAGFDELNFDYIRYPSDGDMKNISYPYSGDTLKPLVLKDFFSHLKESFKDSGVKISADIFGMTTTARDDMGIGQILENTIPFFEAVSPMIYPSHYSTNFQGFKNPAEHPYEVISYVMKEAVNRAVLASSSPSVYRPWIQDFDLGASYGEKEVRAQIKALSDLGINSYMVWSPSNVYTKEAFDLVNLNN